MKFLLIILSFFMPPARPAPEPMRAQPERCVCVGNPRVPVTPAPVVTTPPERRPRPVRDWRISEL